MKVDNAIILAAGTSSRFAPLSYEKHKALTIVKNEVLIERQIRQLKNAGITDIYIVTGYKAEQFKYLRDKYSVNLIYNAHYLDRNNNGSIWVAKDIVKNSFICSSDNYFSENPFESEVDESYYAAVFSTGTTNEWCIKEDGDGFISSVTIGGRNSWYMMGHTFWSEDFSRQFLEILGREYYHPETADRLWEAIYISHLDKLKMRIRRYKPGVIYEFDTLDELRSFDDTYIKDTRSVILKRIARQLGVGEDEIVDINTIRGENTKSTGFCFKCNGTNYEYLYKTKSLRSVATE